MQDFQRADPLNPKTAKFKGKDYAPDRINEQAVEFIKQNKEQPFPVLSDSDTRCIACAGEELKPYLKLNWNDRRLFEMGAMDTPLTLLPSSLCIHDYPDGSISVMSFKRLRSLG